MRKILLFIAAVAIFVLFSTTNSQAITIGFNPVSQDVILGNPADVELTISGLGDFSPDSLSVFDLDISYDPSILNFNSAVYGNQLDLFGFGSLTMTTSGVGSVNLLEISFDFPWDLDTLQPGSFTLATLTFDTLSAGTSSLNISINALDDAWGDSLIADIDIDDPDIVDTESGNINVTSVPEPASLILLGSGLAGIGLIRRFHR